MSTSTSALPSLSEFANASVIRHRPSTIAVRGHVTTVELPSLSQGSPVIRVSFFHGTPLNARRVSPTGNIDYWDELITRRMPAWATAAFAVARLRLLLSVRYHTLQRRQHTS
jgi:hypothetical protein